jgi:type IV pilus assembly protein PilM
MAQGQHCIGLDIGSSAVKLCVLDESEDELQLETFDHTTLPPETIVDGALMDSMTVVDAVETLVERSDLADRKVTALSVSGNSVIIKKITLPLMTQEELEESIEWEAEQYIPFDIDEVFLGFEVLSAQTEQGQMDVVLVAAKKELVNDYQSICHQVGLEPVVVDVDVFCLQNMFEHNYGFREGETIVLVDIGNSVASINIVESGMSVFTRDLKIGGSRITEEIQHQLNITYQEAEIYKLGGTPGEESDEVVPEEVEYIIREQAEEFAGEVQRSLEFYTSTSTQDEVDRIVASGGTAAIPSLIRTLQEISGVETEIANPFRQISRDPDDFPDDWLQSVAPIAGVPVGLALRGAREE